MTQTIQTASAKSKAPIDWHTRQMSQFEAKLYSQWPITYVATYLYISSNLLVNSVLTKRERRKQKKASMLRQCQSLCLKSHVKPLDQLQRNNCECFRQKRTNSNITDQLWPHYVCPSNTKQYPKCKYRQSVVNVYRGRKRQMKKIYLFSIHVLTCFTLLRPMHWFNSMNSSQIRKGFTDCAQLQCVWRSISHNINHRHLD